MTKTDLFDSKTCTLIGLVINLILTVLKSFIGVYSMSYAMMADGIHSATDTLATGAAYFGIRFGEKPPDEDHPYGHAKISFFSAGLEGSLILIAGAATCTIVR